MKTDTPVLFFWFVLVAAAVCAATAVAYAAWGFPNWLFLCAGVSAAIMLALAVELARHAFGREDAEEPGYEYGRCNSRLARRSLRTGVVEFSYVDCGRLHWAAFHHNYWRLFTPNSAVSSAAVAEHAVAIRAKAT